MSERAAAERAQQRRYQQVLTIAGKGTAAHQFRETLRGIALDAAGRVVAVGDSTLRVFDPAGVLLHSWATEKPGQCVALGPDGRVWVGQEGQLEVFAPFEGGGAGEQQARRVDVWRDAELLGRVTAIGHAGDWVLVADASARRIRRFDRTGKHLNDIGGDERARAFLIPNGVLDFAVDAEHVVHAANPGKHRVERYTLAGELVGRMGRFDGRDPEGFAGCCNPTNVTLAGGGRLCVSEKAAPRVKLYDGAGKLLAIVSDEAFDPGCKNMDVAVDALGRVFVVDTVRLTICVFAARENGKEEGARR